MYFPATQRLASFWASRTPCHDLALKDLSASLPTSVTSPTFHVFEQLVPVPEPDPPPEPQANATITAVARTAIRRITLIAGLPVLGMCLSLVSPRLDVASVYPQ